MNERKIIASKTVCLRSDMEVAFSRYAGGKAMHGAAYRNPTLSSLKRVQQLINTPEREEPVLVSLFGDGCFGVHRTFYVWNDPKPEPLPITRYWMNENTGNVIAREDGDGPGQPWFEIAFEDYDKALRPLE